MCVDMMARHPTAADASREDLCQCLSATSTRDLEKRLLSRAQDSADVVASRMAKASDEISHYREYDYILVNADLIRQSKRFGRFCKRNGYVVIGRLG